MTKAPQNVYGQVVPTIHHLQIINLVRQVREVLLVAMERDELARLHLLQLYQNGVIQPVHGDADREVGAHAGQAEALDAAHAAPEPRLEPEAGASPCISS